MPSPSTSPVEPGGLGGADVIALTGIIVAALVALAGYLLTQAWNRRERWARSFADALAAVEDFLELPYRVRRRPAQDDGATRFAITSEISDVQARATR